MKKTAVILLAGILILSLPGCGEDSSMVSQDPSLTTETAENRDPEQQAEEENEEAEDRPSEERQAEDPAGEEEEEKMTEITITAGEKKFSAKLYDSETSRAFAGKLPMTIEMSELNGNEKYYYMPESLPTRAERPGRIKTGDLMLFGSDCIVLFYESFSTSYSYTPVGYVEDPYSLAEALGSGSAQVTFEIG